MAFEKLPVELISHIASYIDDPCDLKAFQQINRNTYAIIHPSFNDRYDYPDAWYEAWVDFNDSEDERDDFFPEHVTTREERRKFMDLGSLIWESCYRGYYRLTKALIKRGAPVKHAVDLRDKEADYGILEPIVIAAKEGHLEIVRLLLDHGADIEAKTFWMGKAEGGNALQAAARNGYIDIMELLLQRGADPEVYDESDGEAPLLLAGDARTVQLLLKHGANANVQDMETGRTALHNCVRYDWSAETETSAAVADIETMRTLLDHGTEINVRDVEGRTILHLAVESNLVEGVQFLCEQRVDVNIADREGLRAKDLAVRKGFDNIAKILTDASISSCVQVVAL
ncbi:hypothetical protein VTN00DRAFT_1598 [Thermoascus crustaceus]|uniref:uncharacterized protein n=1 Tax=Thermoascus crustaceus TaxID=5088 RepID=UPI003743B2AA